MSSPYAPPAASEPGTMFVIRAYRAYAVLSFVLYLAGAIVIGKYASGGMAIGAGLLAAFYAFATFAPRTPAGWAIALIAIGVGATSITLLFAAPLLIVWLRPTTKAAFRRLP